MNTKCKTGCPDVFEVELFCGDTLDKSIEKIKSESLRIKRKTFGNFNGHKIYSYETTDQIYTEVTGKTKAGHDAWMKSEHEERERKEKEHLLKIPQLTKEYIEKANGIIRDDKLDLWAECVPIRLNDLYKGMELQSTLDIAEILKFKDYEEAEKEFRDQGHSGMSHSLVCHMLKEFADNGKQFVAGLK